MLVDLQSLNLLEALGIVIIDNLYIAVHHTVDLLISGVHKKWPSLKREYLASWSCNDNVFLPHLFDYLCTDLLVSTTKDISLATYDSDDNLGRLITDYIQNLLLVHI